MDHPTRAVRRPILADPERDAEYRTDGFSVLPMVDEVTVGQLRSFALEVIPAGAGPMFTPYRNDTADLRTRIDRYLRTTLADYVDRVLIDCDLYIAGLLAKFPSPDSGLDLHRDWVFVDEAAYSSGIIWIPLQDTTADNGALLVVPGSHRAGSGRCPDDGPEGGRPDDPGASELGQEIVEVTSGTPIVYDNRLVHGSTANSSPDLRIAVGLGFLPTEADLIHHSDGEANAPVTLVVPPDFYLDYAPGQSFTAVEPTIEPAPGSTEPGPSPTAGDRPGRPSVAVIMPALDEAAGIVGAVLRACKELRALTDAGAISSFEIIVVDDGSTDATVELVEAEDWAASVRIVRHRTNRGVGAALRTGLDAATTDVVVYTDADSPVSLEHLAPALQQFEVPDVGLVVGRRRSFDADPHLRALASRAYDHLVWAVFGIRCVDVNFPFKVLRTSTARSLGLRSDGALVDVELLARIRRAGLRTETLVVDYEPRLFGESKTMSYRLLRRLAVEMLRYRKELRSSDDRAGERARATSPSGPR